MEKKKRNIVEWAMHYRQIIIMVVCCLIAFGIYSLPNMRKDEFWSKFKHGVQNFKAQLPSNVLALQVNDDFGDTSSLLITMATEAILDDDADKYSVYFPEAVIKFKQLSYNEASSPIEVRLSNTNEKVLTGDAEKVMEIMKAMPELTLVRTNFNEPQATTMIRLKEDEAARLGITNATIETTLAMRYGSGMSIANVWEGDHQVPIVLKSNRSDHSNTDDLLNEQIPVAGGLKTVPLRQVADLVPSTQYGQIVRRNGVPTIAYLLVFEGTEKERQRVLDIEKE